MVNIDGSMQEHQEREDLFVDASDHVGLTPKLGESAAMVEEGETSRRRRSREQDLERLQARLDASSAECRKYKEEREVFGREVVALRSDLLDLIDQQFLNREELVEDFQRLENRQKEHDDISSPTSLQSMVKDCSRFAVHLKGVLDDRLNTDGALLKNKEQEIEFLNSKLLEYDVFRDVVIFYLGAVRGDCSQTMHEYINSIKIRLLALIPTMNGAETVSFSEEEEVFDDISLIEKRTMLLLERHNKLSLEAEQLGQFLEEIKPGYLATQTNESGSVFTIAQQVLHESKKKEGELEERIRELEEQNMKMDEQIAGLNKDKEDADTEMGKIRTELEQSDSRLLAAKEKLSIAVTKGKQLVQHRDSLKQSLSDKTTELDKCLHELRQKANALETVEVRNEELKQLLQEKTSELDECLLELRLKSDAFNMENRNSEELKQLLAENKDQLENCLLDLQHKSKDLQSFTEKNCDLEKCLFDLKRNSDALKQALAERDIELEKCLLELEEKTFFAMNTQSLVRSLQDLALNRDKALKDIEESTHNIDFPQDLIYLDIDDKIRWLVTKIRMSDEILQENRRAKDAFFSVGAPEAVSSTELDSQVEWLVRSFTQSKDEVSKLQSKLKEVEILEESVLKEKEEKESLLIELEELKVDHKKFAENLAVISSEKERFLEFLKEVNETKLDDQLSVDMDATLDISIVYLREKMKLSLNDHIKLENMQKLLHVTSVELTLLEKIVEELLMDGLKMTSLSDELGIALKEIYDLKNEKESMKNELERLEEKNSLIRDKLSMAVKKGKGLVQEREGFKLALAEKSSEIEKLKEDLQLQESKLCEYREQIESLCAYPEQVQKLEVKVASLKDEKEQNEHFLNESKDTLKKLVNSINNIAVHTDKIFEAPIEKVEWIAGQITEREIANANLEQELEKVKIDADLNSNKLAEALETLKSLEMDLHNKEEHIRDIYDEKNSFEVSKTKVEEELGKAREESFMQTSKLADAYAAMKSLEDELLSAEDKVSALDSEKNRIVSKNNLEISSLNVKLAELMEALSKTQGNSENQSAELLSELRKLQIFMRNEGFFQLMFQQFHNKVEGLKQVWMLVQEIHDNLTAKGLHIHPEMEIYPAFASLSSLPCFEDFIKNENFLTEAVLEDTGAVTCKEIIQKIYEEARFANDRFTGLSKHMDDYIKLTLQTLQVAKDEFIRLLLVGESLNLNIKSLEARNQAQEFEISSLQREATRLLSACNDATQELRVKIPDFSCFDSEHEDFPSGIEMNSPPSFQGVAAKMDVSYFAQAADNLSLTCRKVITQYQNLAKMNKEMSVSIENLKNKLSHAELTAETAINERKLIQERALKLESDMKGLQDVCNEMEGKLKGYQSKEDLINEKEAELKRLELSLTAEDREAGDVIISKDQVEVLLNKVNKLIVLASSSPQSDSLSQEVYFSSPIDKLFYVVDKFSEFQKEVYSLTCDIENLRKTSESISVDLHDLELMKSELSEFTIILEKITQKFARSYTIEDPKPVTATELIGALEKQMIAMNVDLENSKSELRELGGELGAKDEIVDELSGKIKYLEDSLARNQQPIVKERSVFESSSGMTRPEITEIEEGSVGTSSKPSAASAHVRTTRKGSNEHLVLNIHSESEQLITSHETDEKGHVFKSLNTSGLIPKHGRLIADRVDGIWVSGGRILMSKPGARLGLIGYWIFLHLWLLGSIL